MAGFDGSYGPILTLQFKKSGTWTNVDTADYLEIGIMRGRQNVLAAIEAGTMTVRLNNRSGIYGTTATSGTWTAGGVSIIRPGMEARLLATWSATNYTLFTGYLETPYSDEGINPSVTLRFADGMWVIARATAPVLTVAQVATYQGETTAARAGRMLDLAGWSASARSLSGSVTLNGDPQDRSCLAILRECANAQVGKFYITRDGVAKLETLSDKFSKPTQLAFNDDGTSNTVFYRSIVTDVGADQMANDATITRAPSKTYRAYESASVSARGYKSVTIPAPVSSDSTASNLSLIYGKQWATPQLRVSNLTFNGMGLGALYPDFLASEIGDLCSVVRHTIDSRTLSFELVLEGYQYAITRNGWAAKWFTSPINPYTISL